MSPLFVRAVGTALAASLCLAGPAAARSPELEARLTAAAPADPAPPGFFDLKDGTVGYIPASVKPEVPAPLLVLLHGAGGEGADMVERFRAAADRRGIILVAPKSGGITWDTVQLYNPNSGRFAPIAKLPTANPPMPFDADVGRVDAAIARLAPHVAVDPARVAILGFSDGATYALALGCRNPALFGTVIAMAPGFAAPSWAKGDQRVLLVHGTKDRVLPFDYAKREILPNLRRNGHDVTFWRFDGGHAMPDDMIAGALDFWLDGRSDFDSRRVARR